MGDWSAGEDRLDEDDSKLSQEELDALLRSSKLFFFKV